jgi:hypothetical protein
MRSITNRHIQDLESKSASEFKFKVKCVTVAIYEKGGATILQPLVDEQEAGAIPEMFHNQTLEIWLSNGKSNASMFEIAILKYKQVKQAAKKCSKIEDQICLKNHFEDIVNCEQCPLNEENLDS